MVWQKIPNRIRFQPNTRARRGFADDNQGYSFTQKPELDVVWQKIPNRISFQQNTRARCRLAEDTKQDKVLLKHKLDVVSEDTE